MSINVKRNGAYAAVTGVFVKRGGVYAAVAGAYVKRAGAYESCLSQGYPRKVFGLNMPFGDLVAGALTSNSSWRTVRTFAKPFKRIRCHLFNLSTSATLVGTKASWSPSESLAGVQRPTIGGVTSDASQVPFLFSGSQTVTLPVASVANIPSITTSDWLVTPSIARTDDIGGYPLGYFTQFFTSGAQVGYSQPGTAFSGFLEGLSGMKHKFRVYTQAVDAIASPALFTSTTLTNFCIPMGIEVEYYDGVRTMIVAGDSTLQGTGNTANAGAGLMALATLDGQNSPVDSFVIAQSGSPASRQYTKLMNILAINGADTIYFQPFSVNDTVNYAGSATAAKTRADNLVAYCAANSINLVIDTPLPILVSGSAAVGTTEAAALADMTTYFLSLASPKVKVINLSAFHSSLYSGVWDAAYGFDALHPNPAGHLYRANALAAAIASFG